MGSEDVNYGARPVDGGVSWKQRFSDEVRPQMNKEVWSRAGCTLSGNANFSGTCFASVLFEDRNIAE